MNEPKSLIHHLVEAVDRYCAERRAAASAQDVQLRQPSRLGRLLRWLTPNGGTLLLVALLILTTNVWAKPLLSPASAPGPSAYTVNYQGRLADSGGNLLSGTYGMTFALWDAATGGNLVWEPESHAAVPVSDGLFSVGLGSQTSGGIPTTVWDGDRYLEITVGGETLSPRELIRSVPIAGMALTVPDGAIGSAQIADGAVTQAKTDSLVAAPWSDRTVVVFTHVGTTDTNGIVSINIAGHGFTSIDGVVASNGDDVALLNALVNVYSWNTSEVKVRVWRNGSLVTGSLVRVNLAIMGAR
jgi:hypothetical protein